MTKDIIFFNVIKVLTLTYSDVSYITTLVKLVVLLSCSLIDFKKILSLQKTKS